VTPLRRLARFIGRRPWLARIGQHLVRVDITLQCVTHGRISFGGLAGLTPVLLTTTGRKTGQQRVTPLTAVPDGDSLLLIGSNWGGPQHPGWSANLIANPQATAQVRGHTFQVTATQLTGPLRTEAWATITEAWPAYLDYAERTDREIRVFRISLR
jgi:deazaflavin-dependent oxidoreductase (nitroreductase family)